MAALFLLSGCAGAAIGFGAAGAAVQVPGWVSTAETVVSGLKTLSQLAQNMCWLQAAANARGNSELSTIAGYGCVW